MCNNLILTMNYYLHGSIAASYSVHNEGMNDFMPFVSQQISSLYLLNSDDKMTS